MTVFKALTAALLFSSAVNIANAQDFFISNAKLVTNTSQNPMENADIIIRGGKIAQMGVGLSAPQTAEIIEANGNWVTPGLFAPFSRLGLMDIGGEDVTNDTGSEGSHTSVSELASDSFNPKAVFVANTRRLGVTHAVISPSAVGDSIFGGTGAVINLSGDYDSVETPRAFVFVQLGESGTRRAGGSRAAALQQLRSALKDALAFPGRYSGPEDGDALSRQDASAFVGAARGQMPLMISANRAMDMLNIIALKDDFKNLDIIILGAVEAWQIADELAAADIKVMIDPHQNLPSSFESVGARLDNVIILDEAGVDYAITNASALGIQRPATLAQHAGNAVGNGLEWNKAFAAITSTPAKWFGQNGTISNGDDASLVVWDGDPLNVTSAPIHMLINGERQSLESRQTALRDRYNPTSEDKRLHKYR
ncbi:amidohydrolase family protein [Hellea balneolensis]|uniref:amidohydrolase family protein n=1 Tax=Hellea balneolensis TaxID=287478 RepID=UPI0004008976|nr:amidohydrolase family protein [Hellea balneolensis]